MVRPHGLSGETVVELVSNRPERLKAGSLLYTEGRELRVASARPFKKRWLVRFEGVSDLGAAELLRGRHLLARPITDPDVLWVHELVGSEVRSVSGEPVGAIIAVVANPASDLLELENGRLVPVRFVVDHRQGLVIVDLPEGLLE